MLGDSKSHYFPHNVHYHNTFLPSLTQMARLVPGLMKACLSKNEMCCDWLAVRRRYCPAPYQNINLDLENIEQEDCAEPLHARILQDIKVVKLL